jgi:hypothetical protein
VEGLRFKAERKREGATKREEEAERERKRGRGKGRKQDVYVKKKATKSRKM